MTDIATFTTFLGWCAVLNIGLLFFSAIWLMLFRDLTLFIHSELFRVNQSALDSIYLQYLGQYKLAVLIFNIVPYLALKIMSLSIH